MEDEKEEYRQELEEAVKRKKQQTSGKVKEYHRAYSQCI